MFIFIVGINTAAMLCCEGQGIALRDKDKFLLPRRKMLLH